MQNEGPITQMPAGESSSIDTATADPMPVVRTLRCLDGLFYSSIALALMVFLPGMSGRGWQGLSMGVAIPVFAYGWFCLGLPTDLLQWKRWKLCIAKLRVAGLAFAGLSPVFIWWSRDVNHVYFLVNAMLCGIAGSASMFFIAEACREICVAVGAHGLGREARLTRALVFWFHIIVIWCSGAVLLVGGYAIKGLTARTIVLHMLGMSPENTALDSMLDFRLLRVGFAVAALSPISFFLSLTFRMRLVLGNYLRLKRRMLEEKETAT